MVTIKSKLSSYDNNFKLIRMLAAVGVFISHSFYLSGYSTGGKPALLGYISLNVFFFISGLLVTKSYFDRNAIYYFQSRFLRIFPALIYAVLFSVFVVGTALTNKATLEFLSSSEIYLYVFKNIVLLLSNIPQTLPGVFTEINRTDIVNAPLWSLPYELICYLSLPLLAFFTRAKSQALLFTVLTVILFIFMYSIFVYNYSYRTEIFSWLFGKDAYRLYSLFLLGCLAYLFRKYVVLSSKLIFIFIAIIGLAILVNSRLLLVSVSFIFIGYIVLYLAYMPEKYIKIYNKFGDYSYGVYIFGYPIQQSVEHIYPNLPLWLFTLFSFCITMLLAVISWHIIENYFLMLKKRHKDT